jgi:hypothetical protein
MTENAETKITLSKVPKFKTPGPWEPFEIITLQILTSLTYSLQNFLERVFIIQQEPRKQFKDMTIKSHITGSGMKNSYSIIKSEIFSMVQI